jgi:hypothetical protein
MEHRRSLPEAARDLVFRMKRRKGRPRSRSLPDEACRSCLAAPPLAEQRELILLGDLLAEHPQDPVQLLLFVNITGVDRVPESESNLIHSRSRVFHKLIPSLPK